jgi:hypothetical protein
LTVAAGFCIGYVHAVAQINLHVTPEFERALRRLMKLRGIASKSDAIRIAVKEAAERAIAAPRGSFRSLLGIGLGAPLNPNPRFKSDDDLWRKDGEDGD